MDYSYSNHLTWGVEKQLRNLEMSIMEDVIRRVRKAGTITSAADWQIERLSILGNSSQDIEALIREAVNGNEEEVRRIYAEVVERENLHNRDLYEKVGKESIPYEENQELQLMVEAMVRQSSEDLFNITKSTGFMLDNGQGKKVFTATAEVYNRYLDRAITGMISGAYDYNTLVRRLVSEMTASGLRSDHAFSDGGSSYGVDYASGWHNRVDVAARRALLTGTNQIAGVMSDMTAQQLGATHFEVSWHPGARPEHAEWQGKVYSKEDLVRVCGLGTGPGLEGWNCRHTRYPFIPGISKRTYTDKWLAQQRAQENAPKKFLGKEYTTYEATQRQRRMETSLRAQREKVRLLQVADADPEEITLERCKYQAKLENYRLFSRAMNLSIQDERIYTGRTSGRISPSPKVYAQYQAEQAQKAKERREKARRTVQKEETK